MSDRRSGLTLSTVQLGCHHRWWVSFLHWVSSNAVWMAKGVAVGELVIGVALVLGLFTGVFAFLGVVMNFSFVFSGSAGVNPAFIIVGLLLVLAWRNAGWIGLDRFLLPRLGTPWERGPTTARERSPFETRSPPLAGWWQATRQACWR